MTKLILAGLALIFLISGCTAIGSGIKKFDIGTVDDDLITERLTANYSELRSVAGRFDFSYSTASEKKQSSGYIYLSKNDTVYIEIKGLVGETEAVLFMDKDSLKAVNYFDKILIKGKSDENSIRRVTGMNISVSDLRNSLFCYDQKADSLISVRKDPARIIIRIKLTEKKYQFITLNENLLITEIEEYSERDMVFKKEYDYFSSENGHVMPRRVRIRTFNPPTKLTIFYTDMDLNGYPKEFSEVSL